MSATQTHPNPKHVVAGASVAAVLAIVGSALVTLALGPITPPPWEGFEREGFERAVVGADVEREPLCRNIFDESGSLCTSVETPPTPPEIESCDGTPRLVGLVFDVDEDRSLALFEGYGPRAEGEQVGASTVVAIHDDEAWLVTTTSRCRLGLFDRSRREAITAEPPAPASIPRPVPRDVVSQVLQNPSLLGSARVVQSRDGFRVYGVRAGELLYDAGLRNGDVLLRIGDLVISNPEDLLRAYTEYRDATQLEVVVHRRGTEQRLRVSTR